MTIHSNAKQDNTVFAEVSVTPANNMISLRHSTHLCQTWCYYMQIHTHRMEGPQMLRQTKASKHKVAIVGPFEKQPTTPIHPPKQCCHSTGDSPRETLEATHASPF